MRNGARDGGGNRLDLVRLVLAGLVLVSHASEYATGNRMQEPLTRLFGTISCGELAVDGFFVLSGFLITQSWHRRPQAGAFLRKRVCRIYPGFVMASLLAILVVGRLGAANPPTYYADIDPLGIATALLTLDPPPTPPVFAGYPYPFVDGALWTISHEFTCYLALMVAGLLGLLADRRAVLALWIGSVAFYLALHVARVGTGGPAVFYDALGSQVRFAMLFLSGVAFATLGLHRDRRPAMVAAAAVALPVGLCVPLLAEPALATAGAYLLLILGLTPRRSTGWPLPDISYGTYLYGAPVQMLILFWRPDLPWPVVFLASLGLAAMLGAVSWRWIERPALRHAGGGAARSPAGNAATTAASSARIASVSALAEGIARR